MARLKLCKLSAEDDVTAGVRALCTNVMSLVEARSVAVRTIDISGVIPLPAERKRYLFAGCRAALI